MKWTWKSKCTNCKAHCCKNCRNFGETSSKQCLSQFRCNKRIDKGLFRKACRMQARNNPNFPRPSNTRQCFCRKANNSSRKQRCRCRILRRSTCPEPRCTRIRRSTERKRIGRLHRNQQCKNLSRRIGLPKCTKCNLQAPFPQRTGCLRCNNLRLCTRCRRHRSSTLTKRTQWRPQVWCSNTFDCCNSGNRTCSTRNKFRTGRLMQRRCRQCIAPARRQPCKSLRNWTKNEDWNTGKSGSNCPDCGHNPCSKHRLFCNHKPRGRLKAPRRTRYNFPNTALAENRPG